MYNAVILNAHDQPQLRSRGYRDHVASNIPVIKSDLMSTKSYVTNRWFDGDSMANKSSTVPTSLPWLVEAQNRSYSDWHPPQNKIYNYYDVPCSSSDQQDNGWSKIDAIEPTIINAGLSTITQPCSAITNTGLSTPSTAINTLQKVNVESSPFYYGCSCGHNFVYRSFDPERNDPKLDVIMKSPVVNVRLR